MRKLFLRLALMLAMAGALVVVPANFAGSKAFDGPPHDPFCSYCEAEVNACHESCGPPGTPGRIGCIGACNLAYRDCEITYCYCDPAVCGSPNRSLFRK